MISQGTRDWTDYHVEAPVMIRLAASGGLGARVQGLRRYYALMLDKIGLVRLVKALDGVTTLAASPFLVERDRSYLLELDVNGSRIIGSIDGQAIFDVADTDRPLLAGGVALVVQDGCLSAGVVRVRPLT